MINLHAQILPIKILISKHNISTTDDRNKKNVFTENFKIKNEHMSCCIDNFQK